MTIPGKRHAPLLRPAIFGLADGCMSLLGVVLFLHGGVALVVFMSALMGGISSAVSMAGGQFMADGQVLPATVMGAATGIGGILPAIPYLFLSGSRALWACMGIVAAIGLTVGLMRGQASDDHSKRYMLISTFILLSLIFAVVLACTLIFPTPV